MRDLMCFVVRYSDLCSLFWLVAVCSSNLCVELLYGGSRSETILSQFVLQHLV